MQRATVSIPSGQDTVSVVFPQSYSSPPGVFITLNRPMVGENISGWQIVSKTTTGFTVQFGAPMPGTGYSFDWIAVQ